MGGDNQFFAILVCASPIPPTTTSSEEGSDDSATYRRPGNILDVLQFTQHQTTVIH